MSTHAGQTSRTRAASGATAPAATAKPTAVVTRTATRNGVPWHRITITHPDGTQSFVSVNARVFPSRTAAKAEAIRFALHGQDQHHAVVVEQAKPTYASEAARTGVASESATQQDRLAALARGEGHTALADAHERAAAALRDIYQQGAIEVMNRGNGKAKTATRAAALEARRAASERLRQAHAQIAAHQPSRATAEAPKAARAPRAAPRAAKATAKATAKAPAEASKTASPPKPTTAAARKAQATETARQVMTHEAAMTRATQDNRGDSSAFHRAYQAQQEALGTLRPQVAALTLAARRAVVSGMGISETQARRWGLLAEGETLAKPTRSRKTK